MATVTLGLGTAHGPQLIVPPELWKLRVEADRKNASLHYRGGVYDFETLARLRRDEALPRHLTPEAQAAHFERAQAALRQVRQAYIDSAPDIAVIVGNDQLEIYTEANIPAFSIYRGAHVENRPLPEHVARALPPGILQAQDAYSPPADARYPCHPELADYLLEAMMDHGFDTAQSSRLPTGPHGNDSVPHAYGFVYRRLMDDRPIPTVPVMVNTHYAPNRPRAARCYDFGVALGQALSAWPGSLRVALIASGGMTHYVIDESFDLRLLELMRTGDRAGLAELEETAFAAGGTAEIKNWLPVAGAMAACGLPMQVIDYVPCYRSEAGTGNAMAFAAWSADKAA
ncbi:Gallate dioxygenase [Pigmentiphaga humi]|uniref:Gallate dioxygenase n=1 Tax=Pigmentiphaga humi TaxID=2478468 RepID=A0A3P4B9R7_9BURK|nr:protocatechuate 3,4-dioxygenase [Pigmentiphaga humi]VCU71875.1 Gallate dioxygenase [Pigmentiphaga humi]